MSNLSTSIPELFYDIISRVLPGVAITSGVLILLVMSNNLIINPQVVDFITSINFLFLALAFAYLLGSLLGTISQALDVIFRRSYNPAIDYLRIVPPKGNSKPMAHYIEILLGLPFSLLLLNEYRPKANENDISQMRDLIQKRFGESVLGSHKNLIACRDYIRANEKESGGIVMKMMAESAMCRNLVVVFLILMLISLYFSLESAIVVNALLCTLSFANFSYRRRLYVIQIYNFFFAIEKGNLHPHS